MTTDPHLYSAGAFIAAAAERGLRLAVAESLTGGLLASEFVAVPGSSRVFSGGVVAYDTALKHSVLGVDAELLRVHGPVDAEVARQMARGVRRACAVDGREADIGIATTGVAGPEPDPQTGQPPGTVWVAVSGPGGDHAAPLDGLSGLDRIGIRQATVKSAIEFAIREAGM